MSRDIKNLIKEMTLEEKASLCSGLDSWKTKPIKRLNIPSIMMTDGPHGLRKQYENADLFDVKTSVPSTCFPSAAGVACTWNKNLIRKMGVALGKEALAQNVSIILGPGANIKRSPLCGRNFEYFSEDPYLSSKMASNHISGVQSQGVGTSLKHFAANNQEHRRMTIDVKISQRALREIYLASFENAVKESNPWTVMCSYNKVNGQFACEHKTLLTDILKNEWGHQGIVVSDWGAVNDRVACLNAGLELEMPASGGMRDKEIVEGVKSGLLKESVLDESVERLLTLIFRGFDNLKENYFCDMEEHHLLAREIAGESMVLLKNENSILPLKREGTISIIGGFVKKPRIQGGGSSHITPTKIDDVYEEIKKSSHGIPQILFAQGYNTEDDVANPQYIKEAIDIAAKSDVTVIFAGLPDHYESEGYDRKHMCIPKSHSELIEEISKVQKNIVVVLSNGSPVEMPWLDKVCGVLEGYLGGQAFGGAVADILFGDVNPSGKLAETFPVKLSHNPSHLNFPGEGDLVEYKEDIFVGYRYYDTKDIEPLFPFGYGLSYTQFEYSNLVIDKPQMSDTDTLNVSVNVKNTGKVKGSEILQLYVKDVESTVMRPLKELKGFEKVELSPGEEKTLSFTLNKRSFAYYNSNIEDWHVESGDFEILIGKSSRDIVLSQRVKVNSTNELKKTYHLNSTIGDITKDSNASNVFKPLIDQMSQKLQIEEGNKDSEDIVTAMFNYMPLRSLITFSDGAITKKILENLISKANKPQS